MKIVELFSGTGVISSAFRAHGHETYTVDWNEEFSPDLCIDIEKLSASQIIKNFGVPDVLWAAPDCSTYSVAAISAHRTKNERTGNLDPISDKARKSDRTVKHLLEIIQDLQKRNPKMLYFIENPRAGLAKMIFMRKLQRYKRLITFCKYQKELPVRRRRMKPTNIWTNHPTPCFEPPCNAGDKCHSPAPRGSKMGTESLKNAEERGKYPKKLCEHIVKICEDYQKQR